MAALTQHLPDDQHQRLRKLAQSRGIHIDRLLDDRITIMPAELDAETPFRLRAARGAGKASRGLELLGKAALDSGSAV